MREFDTLIGRRVVGRYIDGQTVSGIVRDSRMRYQTMIHYVDLDSPIEVYGENRKSVILEFKELVKVD